MSDGATPTRREINGCGLVAAVMMFRRGSSRLAMMDPFGPTCVQRGSAALDPRREQRENLLTSSGPVVSSTEGQIISNLDIHATSGNGVTVLHSDVTVRNCRIRHAAGHGVHAQGVTTLVLQDLEIDCLHPASSRKREDHEYNNIDLGDCPRAVITGVKASGGSSNIYAVNSQGLHLALLELYDARGPMPRGQNVQFNQSPNSILEDFSAENGPTSWTEDNISVFRSDRCVIRRGLVSYNNSPTGDGVMLEGSFDCLVEDVDAIQQGNGAFAAVPEEEVGSGGCTFRRCRTRESYNAPRDGREAPSSNGLSFYTLVSPGSRKHRVIDCHYDALANPHNLIWDLQSVESGWSFTRRKFVPRRPQRLVFAW